MDNMDTIASKVSKANVNMVTLAENSKHRVDWGCSSFFAGELSPVSRQSYAYAGSFAVAQEVARIFGSPYNDRSGLRWSVAILRVKSYANASHLTISVDRRTLRIRVTVLSGGELPKVDSEGMIKPDQPDSSSPVVEYDLLNNSGPVRLDCEVPYPPLESAMLDFSDREPMSNNRQYWLGVNRGLPCFFKKGGCFDAICHDQQVPFLNNAIQTWLSMVMAWSPMKLAVHPSVWRPLPTL